MDKTEQNILKGCGKKIQKCYNNSICGQISKGQQKAKKGKQVYCPNCRMIIKGYQLAKKEAQELFMQGKYGKQFKKETAEKVEKLKEELANTTRTETTNQIIDKIFKETK